MSYFKKRRGRPHCFIFYEARERGVIIIRTSHWPPQAVRPRPALSGQLSASTGHIAQKKSLTGHRGLVMNIAGTADGSRCPGPCALVLHLPLPLTRRAVAHRRVRLAAGPEASGTGCGLSFADDSDQCALQTRASTSAHAPHGFQLSVSQFHACRPAPCGTPRLSRVRSRICRVSGTRGNIQWDTLGRHLRWCVPPA